jgi:hypothetical protein
MAQLPYYLNEILDFFRQGFENVNAILGLIIAFVAAYQLSGWKKLWGDRAGGDPCPHRCQDSGSGNRPQCAYPFAATARFELLA